MTARRTAHAAAPITRASLRADLVRIGVRWGDTLLLHSSMRAMGWVVGGARSVVLAFLDVLGENGTLVCPAQSPENRDPARWDDTWIPRAWWPSIREHLPAFDPATSTAAAMGLIAEQVRTWPDAVRSDHPQTSFCAIGPLAAELMSGHELDCQLGEKSPLRKLEDADGRVLLLGVPFAKTTAFHLAEYRLDNPPLAVLSCVVQTPEGDREWIEYEDVALDATEFQRLGNDFEASTGSVLTGSVGEARVSLFSVREAVAFAEQWLRKERVDPV